MSVYHALVHQKAAATEDDREDTGAGSHGYQICVILSMNATFNSDSRESLTLIRTPLV